MKKFIMGLLLLVAPFFSSAQTATATGTIVDQNGIVWSGATVTSDFIAAPGHSLIEYVWNGGTTPPAHGNPVVADSSGTFSISLPSNISIFPSPSYWRFTICPRSSTTCAIVNSFLGDGTTDLSSSITPKLPTNSDPTIIQRVYNVAQIINPPIGALVFNIPTGTLKYYNGTAWLDVGSNIPPVQQMTADPTFLPSTGTFTSAQLLQIMDATPGAVIYYTSSPSEVPPDPTTSSSIFTSAINIIATTFFKALAIAPNYTPSDIIQNIITINTTPPTPGVSPTVMTQGVNGALNGYIPFPGGPWYTDETNTPFSQYNANFHSSNVASIHPDDTIPYNITNISTYPISLPTHADFDSISSTSNFIYPAGQIVETDDVLMPNLNGCLAQEGGTDPRTNWSSTTYPGDHHLLCIDNTTGLEWESYQGRTRSGIFRAYNTMLFDTTKQFDGQVTMGTTSVDVAGLPIWPLLYRYDEILAGVINHAGRMTLPSTSCLFSINGDPQGASSGPSGHNGGSTGCAYAPSSWMGQKLLLRPDFDISGFSTTNKIILTAWKKYGIYIADNGARGYVQFTADSRWGNGDDLNLLSNVKLADFNVLNNGTLYNASTDEEDNYTNSVIKTDANTIIPNPSGPPVINSFTASSTSVAVGNSVTFTGNVSNGIKVYVENGGLLNSSGQTTVTPTSTTQYRLIAKNKYGEVQTPYMTVTVTGTQAAAPTCNVPSGSYTTAQTVSCSSTTSGAVIHIQQDGTDATCGSPQYSGPYTYTTTTAISVIACGSNLIPSAVTDYSYTINIPVTHGVVQSATGYPTMTLPATPNSSDIIMVIASVTTDSAPTAPSGFTLLSSTSNDGGVSKLYVWTSTTPGNGTYTFSNAKDGYVSFIALDIIGSNVAGILYNNASVPMVVSNGTVARTTGSETPNVNNMLAITAFAGGSAGAQNPSHTSSAGWTNYDLPGVPYGNLSYATKNNLTSDTTTGIQNTFTSSNVGSFDSNGGPSNTITILLP